MRLSVRPHSITRTCRKCLSTSSTPAESSTSARLRFAPSPTGFLHLGGLRMALLDHILARKWKGKWLLRIEDTDQSRIVPGAVDALRRDLEWAGLNYDEGVGVGGSYGPYVQSERLDLYQHHAKELLSNGLAYECFCSADELLAIRTDLHKRGIMRSYDGRCRHLTEEDKSRRKKAGHRYVVRFKSPGGYPALPRDLVFGDLEESSNAPDQSFEDYILLKSDNYPTYHLASVVDDHHMDITHVVRGEEWLPSLPKHHQLYNAFGWTPPQYAHIPVLVNPDGSKLSKRFGDVRVEQYRDKGYEPEALVNFLALIGWDYISALEAINTTDSQPKYGPDTEVLPPHHRADTHSLYEIFTLPQIIGAFDLSHLTHRKAAVDKGKLDFLNKMTLRRKAGRLGKDGEMVEKGKEVLVGNETKEDADKERKQVLERYTQLLKEQKVLKGCELVDDPEYVEKVFDAELPRFSFLPDMAGGSIYLFLEPQYSAMEAESLLKTIDIENYIRNIENIILELEERIQGRTELDEDLGWDAANHLTEKLRLRARSEVMIPMRHALTGRKKGPSVPTIMRLLGPERTMNRLRAGLEYVKAKAASSHQ
ncbi:putative Glutamyl-tRNA synthetase [Naematelia encephala]|uniref:glutamate--tRNA ligase n=1 Tax=Naematelia encephala TaxID=71784 RepID=A0A1Y2ANV4_9TREE|nr:putative Glutamyl-tRNA synthetase [Naematelia encephala]